MDNGFGEMTLGIVGKEGERKCGLMLRWWEEEEADVMRSQKFVNTSSWCCRTLSC